ncbi:unnamed protein product [Toxocara canis]|uniref:Galectin n=1 Tax=Toxocara canis TaxID=6265 RepID=A0A183VCS2_TOXCA|nr:unnamed protein product [Toxocara canis]
MSDGVLTVMQEDDAEQISYFRVLVKFSLERIDEPVFLDFDEKSFTGSITIVNGTFNHSFVQGDLLFHINRVDKADPCVIPYGFAHLVGERTVHSLRYIYKYRVSCSNFLLLRRHIGL